MCCTAACPTPVKRQEDGRVSGLKEAKMAVPLPGGLGEADGLCCNHTAQKRLAPTPPSDFPSLASGAGGGQLGCGLRVSVEVGPEGVRPPAASSA